MLDGAGWAGVGVAATLLGILLTHRMGWIQIRLLRRENALNLAKTAPKIGTSVSLEERKNPNQPICTLVIITSIYNEGDLAISNLKGNWNLTCSKSGFNRTIPITLDHLGNPRPYKMETPFGDVGTWLDVRNGKDITINVDLEIRYGSAVKKGENTYQAKYQYDIGQRDFVRIGN